MARSMMNERNISQTYWVEAIHTDLHILNKAHLRPNNDKIPYELWFVSCPLPPKRTRPNGTDII